MMTHIYTAFNIISIILVSLICIIALSGIAHRLRIIPGSITEKSMRFFSFPEQFVCKYHLFFLVLIFSVFIFSRLYLLGSIPGGIHLDEIGISYDAYSLLNFGTDRFGRHFPVYPTNYGDGNSAMYTYLELLVLRFVPFTVKTARIPAVLCSIPCFFAAYGIEYEIYRNKTSALCGPLFVTIIPYFFASQRWGLDCNLMLDFITISLYFLLSAIRRKKISWYIISGFMFGITLYTYILSYLMIPLFIILLGVYMLIVRKFNLRCFIALCIPVALLGLPLLAEQLVNMGLIQEFTFFGSDFFALPDYRSGEISLKNIPGNLTVILKLMLGGDPLTFNSFHEFGPLYRCMFPLVITGLISSIISLRHKSVSEDHPLIIICLYGLAVYMTALLLDGFNTYNSNSIYIVFSVLASEGICYVMRSFDNTATDDPDIRSLFAVYILLGTLLVSFLLYSEFYFRRQANVYGIHPVFVSTEPGDIINYARNTYDPGHKKNIYIEVNYSERDYSDLTVSLFSHIDPSEWRAHEERKAAGIKPDHIGNIYFTFPEDFNESEDAIYILGTDWGHIASYLMSIGYASDTNFPGYTIIYR